MNVGDERTKNVKALLILGVILLLAAAFAFRPATVLGVNGDALAHSVFGGQLTGSADCKQGGAHHWRCTRTSLESTVRPRTYDVTTRKFGCWVAALDDGEVFTAPVRRWGCIDAIDVISPF